MSDCFYFERKKCDGVTIFDYDCFREAYSDKSSFHIKAVNKINRLSETVIHFVSSLALLCSGRQRSGRPDTSQEFCFLQYKSDINSAFNSLSLSSILRST
jgi:hypothetical protein